MTDELTSQDRGGVYFNLDDGRGAVHEHDLTAADRKKIGLPPKEKAKHEPEEPKPKGKVK